MRLYIKELADEQESLENTGASLSVKHLDTSSGEVKVEKVADTKDLGNIEMVDETATASFTLSSFSQFAITYGDYVKVNVHYVDANGNELRGSTTGVTAYNDSNFSLADYSNRMNQNGYTYLGVITGRIADR